MKNLFNKIKNFDIRIISVLAHILIIIAFLFPIYMFDSMIKQNNVILSKIAEKNILENRTSKPIIEVYRKQLEERHLYYEEYKRIFSFGVIINITLLLFVIFYMYKGSILKKDFEEEYSNYMKDKSDAIKILHLFSIIFLIPYFSHLYIDMISKKNSKYKMILFIMLMTIPATILFIMERIYSLNNEVFFEEYNIYIIFSLIYIIAMTISYIFSNKEKQYLIK